MIELVVPSVSGKLPVTSMFGGPPDWIILAVVALVVFGPNKLPELGRQLGQAVRELKELRDEFWR